MLIKEFTNPNQTNSKQLSSTSLETLVLSAFYPTVAYNACLGTFYRLRKCLDGSFVVVRELSIKEDGMLSVLSSLTGKMTNRKASNLAWEFVNAKRLPDDSAVYFKNLNQGDLAAYNLGVTSKIEYKQLKDALDNLEWVLKIIPDAKEVFSYKVRVKHKGCIVLKSFHDIVAAKRFVRIVSFKSTKIVNKYIVTV